MRGAGRGGFDALESQKRGEGVESKMHNPGGVTAASIGMPKRRLISKNAEGRKKKWKSREE